MPALKMLLLPLLFFFFKPMTSHASINNYPLHDSIFDSHGFTPGKNEKEKRPGIFKRLLGKAASYLAYKKAGKNKTYSLGKTAVIAAGGGLVLLIITMLFSASVAIPALILIFPGGVLGLVSKSKEGKNPSAKLALIISGISLLILLVTLLVAIL